MPEERIGISPCEWIRQYWSLYTELYGPNSHPQEDPDGAARDTNVTSLLNAKFYTLLT